MRLSALMSIYIDESPNYFQKCLESFVNQTVPADELILVEDGKLTDELYQLIDFYRDKINIISVRLVSNVGLAKALNAGIEHCKGDFIARMDCDDILFHNRFEIQLNRMLQKDVDILGSFATEIDNDGNIGELRKMPVEHKRIINSLWANPMIHPSVMFRKESLSKIGNYDEMLRRRQDYELWFRAHSHELVFDNIPQPLIYYRFSTDTHKKQSVKLAFEQGVIGFRGARASKMRFYKSIFCFVPFFRSLLPSVLQHKLYQLLKRFDPRSVG